MSIKNGGHSASKALSEKISRLAAKTRGRSIDGCTHELRHALGLFNIYGRIPFKQRKGCSYFYKLINENPIKHDCWLDLRLTLERDVLDHDEDFRFYPSQYDVTITKIIKLKDFNV